MQETCNADQSRHSALFDLINPPQQTHTHKCTHVQSHMSVHMLTFLVEPDGQAEGCVSGLVLPDDAGLAVLQQLHYGQGLALGAVLAGIVEGRVPHLVGGVHLQK